MRTSEYLRAARARIDTPDKWWQSGNGNASGGTCALLAFDAECGDTHPAYDVFCRAAGLAEPCEIPNWNDAPERTHVEVMVAFAEAIANAEAAEQEFSPSACEPVTFDAMPMDLVRKALDSAPFTAEEHAAWVRAWEGI